MTPQELWDEIPSNAFGETPEDLADREPKRYRAIIARRAIEGAYEDADDPEQGVKDLLADLRHLCDQCELDFAELDREAYQSYARENHDMRTAKA